MATREILLELCSGDAEAAEFIHQLWSFGDTWDDIVDRDNTKTADEINAGIMWALFGLHDSVFYRKHEAALRPAMMLAIGSWFVSNRFEKSGERFKIQQAYFIRCASYNVYCLAVLLAAGFNQHLKAIEFFYSGEPGDTLESYIAEHSNGIHEQRRAAAA